MSAPALSWDAMLNKTRIEFELISDAGMYLFFEKGMRGRDFYISETYSRANNKHSKSYDTKKESEHIIYLDANNLYGYAMSTFFPTSAFKWIDPKHFGSNTCSSNSSKVCVLEVDLAYPKELRAFQNDYTSI